MGWAIAGLQAPAGTANRGSYEMAFHFSTGLVLAGQTRTGLHPHQAAKGVEPGRVRVEGVSGES